MAIPGMPLAQSNVQILGAPQVGRKVRRPKHTFQVSHRPYQLQPFLIAPVLPGDTFNNALLQVRAVSDPIKNPLIGWWLEHYLFYVPHIAMPRVSEYKEMMLDPTYTVTTDADEDPYYHPGGAVNWAKQCLQVVTEDFFRGDEEGWNDADKVLDTLPLSSIVSDSWLDSVRDTTSIGGAEDEPEDPLFPNLDASMELWQSLKLVGMTNATYEDFIAMFGVRAPQGDIEAKPELLRYSRDWTYPTNTVDPSSGTPSSAVSWSIRERADKQRFFKYPGFIFGVTCARPKVYLSRQRGSASSMLDNAMAWLPAILRGDPDTAAAMGFREYANTAGPLGAGGVATTSAPTNGYIVDVRDLFLYGDQFHNYGQAPADTNKNLVALPTATLGKRYAASADIDALFAAASPANKIRQDGVCDLFIKSWIGDDLLKG